MISPTAPGNGVLDANGVIGLAKSGCFALLPQLFDQVFVPASVVREVIDPVSEGALRAALASWLTQAAPSLGALQQVPARLRGADREVVALALDRKSSAIVTGDRKITRCAQTLGVRSITAEDVIRILAEAGLIVAARPHLDRMIRLGFCIADDVYAAILRGLGE